MDITCSMDPTLIITADGNMLHVTFLGYQCNFTMGNKVTRKSVHSHETKQSNSVIMPDRKGKANLEA